MAGYQLTIAGEALHTEETLEVINPSTGMVFAECPNTTPGQLDAAVDGAYGAFRAWSEDEDARRRALRDCATRLRESAPEISRVLTREQGKSLENALLEVKAYAALLFDVYADMPLATEILQDDDTQRIELHRKPLGVVGAITPWNYPISQACWKIVPALLAGNTVILKPSPFTPLSSLMLGEVLSDALPPGVLTVLSGGDELGRWICEHPMVRKISFTGSIATGKKVQAAATPDLKRVTLELGGNDPAIVLGDVDPKSVAENLFRSAFDNSGQLCVAIKRLYVDESIYPQVLSEVTEIARTAKFGDGFEEGVEYGPINNKQQFQRVSELVEDAKADGATIHTGGAPMDRGGYFYAPTIVSDVAEGTRLVDEEQFGPVLPVMPFHNVDEAIDRANGTHFGLGGSIWTNDLQLGGDLASRLDSGTGWVNQHGALTPFAPFGGSKWSGTDCENWTWGMDAFCQLQVINIRKN